MRTGKGSRKITPEENCPLTPKLTLNQTLTLTIGGNFLRDQLSGCPPTLKLTLTLAQTPTPDANLGGGGNFLGGQLSRYQNFFTSIALLILLMKPLYVFRNRYWFFWSLKVNTKTSTYYLKSKPQSRATINCKSCLCFLKFWNYSYYTEY